MKQFLFATTAICAFAGAAAAEVVISGSAEIGIIGVNSDDDTNAFEDGNIQFHTDVDVTFTLSGATDTGLAYGASIDLDESDDGDAFANRTQGGESIFISGGFGTLTMGDTDGALDWALTEVGFDATSINDDSETAGWNGNSGADGTFDGQILRYDYTFGDFGVAVSGEIDDDDSDGSEPILGVGFRGSIDFAGNAIGFGLGYQTGSFGDSQDPVDDVTVVDPVANTTTTTVDSGDFDDSDREVFGASLNASFGAIEVGVSYLDFEVSTRTLAETTVVDNGTGVVTTEDVILGVDSSGNHYGVGIGYNAGPLSLHANYGEYDYDDGSDADGIGVTAGYELGDDIEVQFGYGNGEGRDGNDVEQFSFGVSMSF